MQEGEAEVAQHLRGLGCPPLQLAVPWILTAFAGHLAVGEVLLLWDRIIGFDSLLPLPLLAVAVLAFRRQVRPPTILPPLLCNLACAEAWLQIRYCTCGHRYSFVHSALLSLAACEHQCLLSLQ